MSVFTQPVRFKYAGRSKPLPVVEDEMDVVTAAQLDNLRKRVARLEEDKALLTAERDMLHAECEDLKNQLRLLQLRGAEVQPKQVVIP